jgi:hypothetical protein
MKKKRERILLTFTCAVTIWLLTLVSCSLTPLEAGLVGAVAGTTTTMYLDDDPDIIVGDGSTVVQESPDNAYGLVAVVIENAWALALLAAAFWFLPSPSEIRKRFKK